MNQSATKLSGWANHIACWQRSSLTQRDYCEEHGLALSTFQLYRRRLLSGEDGRGSSSARAGCVELVPVPSRLSGVDCHSESEAIVVRVGRYLVGVSDPRVNPETLHSVLDVLEARS
jgi:hypothetical protein